MGAAAEGCSRVNLDDDIVVLLVSEGLPGRFDDDVAVQTKRFEKSFPVVDPVFFLGGPQSDLASSHRKKCGEFLYFRADFCHHLIQILFLVNVTRDACGSVVRRDLVRKKVHVHDLPVFLGERHMVFHFHSLDAHLLQLVA